MNDSDYTNVILEEVRSQMQAVLEIVADNQQKIATVNRIEQNVDSLVKDMRIVKAAVIDTSEETKLLERRVTALEARS